MTKQVYQFLFVDIDRFLIPHPSSCKSNDLLELNGYIKSAPIMVRGHSNQLYFALKVVFL